MSPSPRPLSRRRALASLGSVAAGALVAPRQVLATAGARGPAPTPEARRPASRLAATSDLSHLAWVWQFRHDGDPAEIRDALAAHGLGISLKTHDGSNWMSKYDPTDHAIDGPADVQRIAAYFENAGVPFHAWAVVKGRDVEREAQMAAEVVSAGARSLFLDLEAHSGFWVGTAEAAERYGDELRRLAPGAWLSTSIDPRPWEIDRIPLDEFAAFTDEIAPQVYWQMFSTSGNHRKYRESGYDPGDGGMTPGFVLAAAVDKLRRFERIIHPIGDGTVAADPDWRYFIDHAYEALAETVSVWRYGVAEPGIWALLRDTPPRVSTYVVQPGDSLSALASRWGTTVQAIAEANGITNPNLIAVGTTLRLPGGAAPPPDAGAAPGPATAAGSYVVQPGDTLGAIAAAYGTTVEALMSANGISDPRFLRAGQELVIPGGSSSSSAPAPASRTHTVVPGDTLSAIAARYGTTIDAIMAANGIANPHLLSIGDQLSIP